MANRAENARRGNPADNTWGRVHVPLPASLRSLSTYSDAFRPANILAHHAAWPSEKHAALSESGPVDVHMITVPANKGNISIMWRHV